MDMKIIELIKKNKVGTFLVVLSSILVVAVVIMAVILVNKTDNSQDDLVKDAPSDENSLAEDDEKSEGDSSLPQGDNDNPSAPNNPGQSGNNNGNTDTGGNSGGSNNSGGPTSSDNSNSGGQNTPNDNNLVVDTYPNLTMQTMSISDCPSGSRAIARDFRNGQEYYVRKFGNTCWMVTNLRYGGGGDNKYKDTKKVANISYVNLNYTESQYVVRNSGNSTNFEDFTTFWGYLYNYCAAMGGSAKACSKNHIDSEIDKNIDICPAGWHLPSRDEYKAIITKSGSVSSAWQGVQSGAYGTNTVIISPGRGGFYWTSTAHNYVSESEKAYVASFQTTDYNSGLALSADYVRAKSTAAAVRCVRQ
jgi:uncharacterized protein (TIGR02145 family)